MDHTLALPDQPAARAIAERIISHATERLGETPYTGGCRAFYTAQEWAARGERYGTRAELVVVHDGGDLALFFNPDRGGWESTEAMNTALMQMGYYAEPCTGWYTAIYRA